MSDLAHANDIVLLSSSYSEMQGLLEAVYRSLILGKFAIGPRCANGDRLVNFASANRLVVSSTRFQHPKRHLVT